MRRALAGVVLALGACASGRPRASTRNAYESSSSLNAAASHELHTTPPAAGEKPIVYPS